MKTLGIIGAALARGVPALAVAQTAGRPAASEIRRVEVNRFETRRIETSRDAGRIAAGRFDSGLVNGSRIRRPDVITGTRIRIRRPDVRDERPNHHARRRWNAAHDRRDPERRPDMDPSRRRALADSPRRGR